MQIWGQFGLSEVALNQDLTLTYDNFYISYLKYALCEKLCLNYNFDMPPGAKAELLKYEMMISKRVAPMDLNMTKITTIGRTHTLNYGQANLGHGFTT